MSKQRNSETVADLIKPYSGEWVTLSADKKAVLGHSRSLKTALKQAHNKGKAQPLL